MADTQKDYSIWTDPDYLDLRLKSRLQQKMPPQLKAEVSQDQIDLIVDELRIALKSIVDYIQTESPDTSIEVAVDIKIEAAVDFLLLRIKAAVPYCKYVALVKARGETPLSFECFTSKQIGNHDRKVTVFERMVELERKMITAGDRFVSTVDGVKYQVDKITTNLAVTLTRKSDGKKLVVCPLSEFFKSLKYLVA